MCQCICSTEQMIILKDSMWTQRQNSLLCFFWLLKNLPFWSCHSWGAKKRCNVSDTKNAYERTCDKLHLKPKLSNLMPLLRSHLELLTPPRPLLPILRVPPWKLLPWTDPLWKTKKNKENVRALLTVQVNVDNSHPMKYLMLVLHHLHGIPSMSSSMGLIGIPSRSSRGAPSIGAPSMGPESIGTPSTSSSGVPSTYSPIGAPSMSSTTSGCGNEHKKHLLLVTKRIVFKSYVRELWSYYHWSSVTTSLTSTMTTGSFSAARLTRPRKMFCSLIRKGSGYTAQSSHARKHDITRCCHNEENKAQTVEGYTIGHKLLVWIIQC